MSQPFQWNMIALTCCRKGCSTRWTVNRKELEAMDRDSTVALCKEHR